MRKAILMGPFVGELYWEVGRFAPLLPYLKIKKYYKKQIKYIIFTRVDRFDAYGRYADTLVPLRIKGDYKDKQPNCFRLNNYPMREYENLVSQFRKKYEKRYNIINHIYPNVSKSKFVNKNQFPRKHMLFKYKPRSRNYEIINQNIPKDKPIIILAPRFRKGFKRNWNNWPKFYDLICNDKRLDCFRFVICGKEGEYIPDEEDRFHDISKLTLDANSSLIGLLLVLMERAIFVCGSQSAIPNIGLLYRREVLEFGCQKSLHTVTYNIHKTPITFINNKKYDLEPKVLHKKLVELTKKYRV